MGATATPLGTSCWEAKRVRHRSDANLALMASDAVDGHKVLLDRGIAFGPARGTGGVAMPWALPRGRPAAVLGTARVLEQLAVDATAAGRPARDMQAGIRDQSGCGSEIPQRFQCLAAIHCR